MSLLRRASKPTVASPPLLDAGECVSVVRLPTLHDFLTLGKWDDGSTRRLGTASIFWEEGDWKLWLNDKDGGRSCCVSSDTLEGVLAKADQKLSDDTLEWRKARPEQGRAGRK